MIPELQEQVDLRWAAVVDTATRIVGHYQRILEDAEQLSALLNYRKDWLLKHVFPETANQRDCADRILVWVNEHRAGLEGHIASAVMREQEEQARETLLARLNLSPEELTLLGIKR